MHQAGWAAGVLISCSVSLLESTIPHAFMVVFKCRYIAGIAAVVIWNMSCDQPPAVPSQAHQQARCLSETLTQN